MSHYDTAHFYHKQKNKTMSEISERHPQHTQIKVHILIQTIFQIMFVLSYKYIYI